MITKHRFITAVAVTGALAGASATPALAVKKAPKVSDSAAILNVATVAAKAIKDKNWTKYCQMITPQGRYSWASFGGPGGGGTCARGAGTLLTTGQFAGSWAADSLAYFKSGKAKPVIGNTRFFDTSYDAKVEFTLPIQGAEWGQAWYFRALRGKQACYSAKARCWRIGMIANQRPTNQQ